MAAEVPGAIWRPSSLIPVHRRRSQTVGITMHWTVGRKAGDLSVLDGPNVDCQLYVAKDGEVYQLLPLDLEGWHAKRMANAYTVGIEHEGSGEAYTPDQLLASARAAAFVCRRYAIPVRKTDPSGQDLATFRGLFGHRDLSLGGLRVDGNDHTDTVPDGTGWDRYLSLVRANLNPVPEIDLSKLPGNRTLRVAMAGRIWAGWEQAEPVLRWLVEHTPRDPECFITWQAKKGEPGNRWDGPRKVRGVATHLVRKYL